MPLTREERKKLNVFEEEILKMIDDQDDYTRSDLQGAVTVLVWKIYEAGKDEIVGLLKEREISC